jgi:hypothetical protein
MNAFRVVYNAKLVPPPPPQKMHHPRAVKELTQASPLLQLAAPLAVTTTIKYLGATTITIL